MTTIIYEPEGPAVEFIGHAGAGLYGSDPVCAALSILMYTLIAAAPGAQVYSRPGYCRVDGGPIKAQRSGFDGERRRSGESELSGAPREPSEAGLAGMRKKEGAERSFRGSYANHENEVPRASSDDGGSEGCEACADAGYCRVDGGNSPRRCGAPPPPSLSASRPSLRASSACKTCPRQVLPSAEIPAGGSLPSMRGAGERASPDTAFAVVKKGLGLLAEHFPENVRLVVKHRAGWKGDEEEP